VFQPNQNLFASFAALREKMEGLDMPEISSLFKEKRIEIFSPD
jgi:hypothetical protein